MLVEHLDRDIVAYVFKGGKHPSCFMQLQSHSFDTLVLQIGSDPDV
jgi:hypothetical protein